MPQVKSALVYGHSQSGGMGLDVVKAFKANGFKVKRVTHNGADDAKLLALLPATGDPAQYSHVVLYAGGNSDVPTVDLIKAQITHFAGAKVAVVLPPVNVGRNPIKVAAQRVRNKANADGLAGSVPLYSIEAPYSEFTSNTDHVHLAAGSPTSVALANQIAHDMGEGATIGASSPYLPLLLVGGLGLLAIWLAKQSSAGR